jgi:two-component system chemotaxis response regulator CheY
MSENNSHIAVLVVDDSDYSRQAISDLVSSSGYKVVGEAASAQEAIKIAQDNKIDIAVIDCIMPETSGIELTELFKRNFSQMSVIMISSIAPENVIISSISAGASDFLQKPFEKEALIDSIERVLEQAQSQG